MNLVLLLTTTIDIWSHPAKCSWAKPAPDPWQQGPKPTLCRHGGGSILVLLLRCAGLWGLHHSFCWLKQEGCAVRQPGSHLAGGWARGTMCLAASSSGPAKAQAESESERVHHIWWCRTTWMYS